MRDLAVKLRSDRHAAHYTFLTDRLRLRFAIEQSPLFLQRVSGVDRGQWTSCRPLHAGVWSAAEPSFARYIASLQKRDPFTESGPVLISQESRGPGGGTALDGLRYWRRGHVVRASDKHDSTGGRADVVRDTKLLNGSAYARSTRLTFAVPHLGRGELVIKEYLLPSENDAR
jgi:hypothetical protein